MRLRLITLLVVLFSVAGAQEGVRLLRSSQDRSGLSFRLGFDAVPYSVATESGRRTVRFERSEDESLAGLPSLPGVTLFIAVPPNAVVSASISGARRTTMPNSVPAVNRKAVRATDSSLTAADEPLRTDAVYPSADASVVRYLWIGNTYCAAVRVNTHRYAPATASISVLEEADLRIAFVRVPAAWRTNTSPMNAFERDLSRSILNAASAAAFRSAAPASAAPDTAGGWFEYQKDYVKLAAGVDGLYRITYNDLIAYGVDPATVTPSTFKLFVRGVQQPVTVRGEEDGTFDQADVIEFYARRNYDAADYRSIVPKGTDYRQYLNRYTDSTMLWLTWGGAQGLRVPVTDGSGSSADTVQSHRVRLHLERDQRLWYYDVEDPRTQLPFWQEHKTWTWLAFSPGTNTTVSFSAGAVLPGTQVDAVFRFIANGTDGISSASKMGTALNGATVTEGDTFAYRQTINHAVSYPSSKLIEGTNSVRIQGLTGGTYQFLLDWIDIDYSRSTRAVGDTLLFSVPDSVPASYRMVKVTGVTVADPIVYKISPGIRRIVNVAVTGGAQKTCLFADSVKGGDRYYIVAPAKVRSPKFVTKKQFANLRSAARGADHIIITHRSLSVSTAEYASFLQSAAGLRVERVFIDDIYDEFSFGYPEAEGVRDLLRTANQSWQAPAPSYAMLVGEANYDYKFATTGLTKLKPNLVPSYGYPVSDAWFGVWNEQQADIPQMYIGRLPAESDADVAFYLQKHQTYRVRAYDEWNKNFLFFSGGTPTVPGQIEQIRNAHTQVYNTVALPAPVGGTGYHFYKTTNPVSNFGPYGAETVRSAMSGGGLFISYIGHSGTQTWDNGITSVAELKNGASNRFPLISDFGCSTGKFAEPDIDCFGEMFVSQDRDGQAITYLGNSSLGFLSTGLSMASLFYTKLLKDTVTRTGALHLGAKVQMLQNANFSTLSRLFLYTNTFFGDPSVDLRLPTRPNYRLGEGALSVGAESVKDTDDSVALRIVTRNIGRVAAGGTEVRLRVAKDDSVVFASVYALSPDRFIDTTVVRVPVNGRVGKHAVSVTVDSAGMVDELNENDNTAGIEYVVYSSALRTVTREPYYGRRTGVLHFLNPVERLPGVPERLRISLDTAGTFATADEWTKDFDSTITTVALPGLTEGRRYWWRAKLDLPQEEWTTPVSFLAGSTDIPWYVRQPRVSSDFGYRNTLYASDVKAWTLQTGLNALEVTSAGTVAGSFISVEYNGNEQSPNTYFWGIVTARIDTVTLAPFDFRFFVFPENVSAPALTTYINSLPNGALLAMSVCDDGAQSVLGFSGGTTVRKAIETLGSYYVDSVRYRESWAMIGKKGAPKGSVPESYRKQFDGPASVSLNSSTPIDSGSVLFPAAGRATEWDSLLVDASLPPGAVLEIVPIGIGPDATRDTLPAIPVTGSGSVALNGIDAQEHPSMQLLARFRANAGKESPKLSSLGLAFREPAELSLNYQSVSLMKAERVPGTDSVRITGQPADTVPQGKYVAIRWTLRNAGRSAALRVPLKGTVLWDSNAKEELGTTVVDSIPAGGAAYGTLYYNTSAGTGGRRVQITADPFDSTAESFKDNNIIAARFTVVPDPVPPPLPNLSITPASFILPAGRVDSDDSALVRFVVRNTGSARYDSVDIAVVQTHLSSTIRSATIRRPVPVLSDTVSFTAAVKGRPGEHRIAVELDPTSRLEESSKGDNSASAVFTVASTAFTLVQPVPLNGAFVPELVLLNPTIASGGAAPGVTLELDSVPAFTSAFSYTKTAGTVVTRFDISSLPKAKRYHWRARLGPAESPWTVGSFYQGSDSVRQVGQSDQGGWDAGVLTNARSTGDGVVIADAPVRLQLMSAGFADGGFGAMEAGGVPLITANIDTGHFVAVFDSALTVLRYRRFNLYGYPGEADTLTSYLTSVLPGQYVAAVIIGDGSVNMTSSVRTAYQSLGSASVAQVGWRDSWAFLSRKGSGAVAERYRPAATGKAEIDTTIYRRVTTGRSVSGMFGPLVRWGVMSTTADVPAGASVRVAVVGVKAGGGQDTLAAATYSPSLLAGAAPSLDLSAVSARTYPYGKTSITMTRNASGASPLLKAWSLAAGPSPELAVTPEGVSVGATAMTEGESVPLMMTVSNVSGVPADSVTAVILSDDEGSPRVLLRTVIPRLNAGDTAQVRTTYDSRGYPGAHSFLFVVDPDTLFRELDRTNNAVTVPYTVGSDSVRPSLVTTFDGKPASSGDFVRATPEVLIRFSDTNPAPLGPADTSLFTIRLNNRRVFFTPGTAELRLTGTPGEGTVRWTPELPAGENIVQIHAKDVTGNASDTLTLFLTVSSDFRLLYVYNMPNPFRSGTRFTFQLAGPAAPEEAVIRIYTVAGRLIQELRASAGVGFNAVAWDGRDRDGDEIGNGVYLYRLTVRHRDGQVSETSKLVKMR